MIPTINNTIYQVLLLDTDARRPGHFLKTLAKRGLRGTVATTLKSAKNLLDQHHWNMIFLRDDFVAVSGQKNGFEILDQIRFRHPELPILMISDHDSSRQALKAVRLGCIDFITGTPDEDKISTILDHYLPNHPTQSVAMIETDENKTCPIIGRSRMLKDVVQMAQSVAPTAAPILISGPSGTGKELIAQLIHNHSRRAEGPFVRLNCAALSESLLESELFGHERGAFTGAIMLHQGRLERAHGGTILLDEITETPPAFQAKLLRVLEQMDFERVGGSENIRVNVRVVSTTNQDIHSLVQQGKFRADLYYRLAAVRLQMPALNQRMEDLPDLIWWFVNQFAHEAGRAIKSISPETLKVFNLYHWPGNIRQLRNMVRTAMILGCGPSLCVMRIPGIIDELKSTQQVEMSDFNLGQTPLQELERRAILASLAQHEGNQTRAARVLGISDRTLREKVKKYRQQELVTVRS
jgi:two-component system response regulator AtoC